MDVIVTYLFISELILWYENTDGLGSFGPPIEITTSVEGISTVAVADLDNDGDMDVIAGALQRINWYENIDGIGNFSPIRFITSDLDYPSSIFATDINNDGSIDIIACSNSDSKLAWFENSLSNLSINENELINFSVYPNPSNDFIVINSETIIVEIIIYNNLGQQLIAKFNRNNIDISTLNKGLYYLKIKDDRGAIGLKKLIKK